MMAILGWILWILSLPLVWLWQGIVGVYHFLRLGKKVAKSSEDIAALQQEISALRNDLANVAKKAANLPRELTGLSDKFDFRVRGQVVEMIDKQKSVVISHLCLPCFLNENDVCPLRDDGPKRKQFRFYCQKCKQYFSDIEF